MSRRRVADRGRKCGDRRRALRMTRRARRVTGNLLAGGHVVFCATVPARPSTWGSVKALFD